MTYIKLFLIGTLTALASSCSQELEDSQTAGITEISATFADGNTKTVLGEDGTTVLWNPNDEISVFYRTGGIKFTAINTQPVEQTMFVSSQAIIFGGTEGYIKDYLYAVYPYSSSNAQDGELITLTVPSYQTAVEGSFGRGSFPSVGRSKTTDIAFYNVCGGMRFTLCQSGIRKIVLTGNNDETLAGKVKVQFDENGKPKVSAVVAGEKSITLAAPNNGEFQTGKWYYISILPTTFSKSGFSVEFIKRTDESEHGTKTITSAVEVKRSIFGSVENIDSNVSFTVGIASLSISPSAVLVAPMSAAQLSLTILPEGAQYESIKWSSSDKTVATVDEDGMVVGKKEGTCIITATSDNGKTASCTVYVSKTPVITKDASQIDYYSSTLNGSISVIGAESVSKTVLFLFSNTESTLEGLKANGWRIGSSLSGSEFSSSIQDLKCATKYYYVSALTLHGQTYYGEVKNFTTQSFPEPQAVELGLSIKWASFNIGASKPEGYGRYFAWGDVVGQTWADLKWSGGGFSTYPTYELDANKNLKPEYDAAHVLLGGSWRMPTKAEQQELIDNCTSTWTNDYNSTGVAGRIFTSNKTGYTDRSIFLPAAGEGYGTNLSGAGSNGCYRSSTLYNFNYDWHLYFYSGDVNSYSNRRDNGQSVRPVCKSDLEKLEIDDLSVYVKYSHKISVRFFPTSAECALVWASSDNRIASVSSDGTVVGISLGECTITATAANGVKASCKLKVIKTPEEAVDLGLSVLWHQCNLGATNPEEYGSYYAWGETETKSDYSLSTYKYYKTEKGTESGFEIEYMGYTKYLKKSDAEKYGFKGFYDDKTTLEPGDDIAHVKLGGKWRIPTKSELTELFENCTWQWSTYKGVNGYVVKSKKEGYTDKSIFLPAAGEGYGTNLSGAGFNGCYWLSTLYYTGSAYYLNFSSSGVSPVSVDGRCYGLSVRPVSE